MGLQGSLEDLGLGDILQIVSLSRKSGVLSLSCGEERGKILFYDGQVVAAVSSYIKDTLGSLLYQAGILPLAAVRRVEQMTEHGPEPARIKELLKSELQIDPGRVEETIRTHIEKVVFHFFTWPEGIFSFELQEIDSELAALSPQERVLVLEVGLSPQYLAMEGTRIQDEQKRERFEAPVGPPLAGRMAGEARTTLTERVPLPDEQAPEKKGEEKIPPPTAATGKEELIPSREKEDFFADELEEPASWPEASSGEREAEEAEVRPSHPAAQAVAEMAAESKPLIRPSVSPQRISPAEIPAETSKAAELSPDLILVDDEPFLLDSVVHHLSAKGFRCQTSTSVEQARKKIQTLVDLGHRPRAVIADLIMPDSRETSMLGGLELLEVVRSMNPAIPVIITTDYENLPGRARAEELGARFFFMKPKSSQLEEDYQSPELINFVSVLEGALAAEAARTAAVGGAAAGEEGLINLGEELRREFGEEVSPPAEGESRPATPGLQMLKAMISELNDPASNGQITLLILRFAAELMNRAVIFLVAKNQLAGLGQFGINIDGADPQKHVRKIRIPLNEPSIFREAIQKRLPLKKNLKPNKWNQYLVDSLGGIMPKEVFVAPIIAGGKIAAILYGDNAPEDRPIGDTESLEIFLAQAGLAMEKALLERRLREMGSTSESS